MSAMSPFGDTIQKILSHLKQQHEVVLTGDAGAGKTWVARKICESAIKEGLSCGSIWIAPAENPSLTRESLLDVIASQLSLHSSAEDWDDDEDIEEVKVNENMELGILKDRIVEKLEARTAKPKNQAPKAVKGALEKTDVQKPEEKIVLEKPVKGPHEVVPKEKFLLVVVDDITKEQEDNIVPKLKEILPTNHHKILITRKESTNHSTGAGQEGKEDSIQADDPKTIQLEPLGDRAVALLYERLHERVKNKVSEEKLKEIAKKASGLSAEIVLLAAALNHVSQQDDDQELMNAVEDAANLKEGDIKEVLRFAYEMLPEGVTRDCYWLSRQLLIHRHTVHFNELITYWILEGCFEQHSRIEKAYEEGHRVLMDLKDRGMLKGYGNYVYLERAMLKLPDERRNGFSGASKLGLADVLNIGLGRVILADGMIRTVCRDKEKKEISTLVIDGRRLSKVVPGDFFKPMKGLKLLAILNPIFESLPSVLTELKDLQVLVLRGCRHLKTVDAISKLTKLSVLEISGASMMEDMRADIFGGMKNIKSVNLSGLNTASVPDTLLDRAELRFLILRECPKLTSLPSLKNVKKLEMLDLCDSASFDKLLDGTIRSLTELKTLNFSGTKVKQLPILGRLEGLTRILLRNCPLTMIRALAQIPNLEVLDVSGSKSIKDLNSAQLDKNPHLRILDLSDIDLESFPPNISNLTHLNLNGCSKLSKLPFTKLLCKLVFLDLAGAEALADLEDESFEHFKSLRRLNLSGTKIKRLPTLSHLVELRELLLKDCKDLTELHGLTPLKKLEVIDLSGCCSLILGLNESFKGISRLKKLDLSETKIEALPEDCLPSNLCCLSLKNCKILKRLPSLQSLSKLEELDLCGTESLEEFKTDFLESMDKLKILNLSKTHPAELPSFSHLTSLKELHLSGCLHVPSEIENLGELQVLDLSGTNLKLLSLQKFSKLRELLLSNCSELDTLTDLGSLSDLEVLDLSGTGFTRFPDEVKDLANLKKLHLPSMKKMQVDWSKIQYLPADFQLDQVGESETTLPAITRSQGLSVLFRGTGFFHFLEKNPELWACFEEFHFAVWLEDEKILGLAGDMSSFKYLKPRQRFPNSRSCSLLEIHGSVDFSRELKNALGHAQYISVIDNETINHISDLGDGPLSSIKRCWLERCSKLCSLFAEEKDSKIGERLESLYLCSLPSLERLCDEQYQFGIFSNLKDLHLDCCPKLETLFSSSKLPVNLETLSVKFCDKLTTLFKADESSECLMPKLKTMELIDLPELKGIGAVFPALETLKVRRWRNLNNLCRDASKSNTFSNLKNLHLDTCPELKSVFSSSKLPVNLETLRVKFCNKLEILFEDEGSAECKMPNLKTLQLLDLPLLKMIGAVMPPSVTQDIESCPNLENGFSSSQMGAP